MARTTSISTRLFLVVVGLSLAWFTLTTAVQTLGEVRSLRLEADRNLTDVFRSTRAGLEAALWNLDTELLNESVDPLPALVFLAGGEVRNDDGQVVYTWGTIGPGVPRGPEGAVSNPSGTGDLFHRFDLRRTDSMGREQVIGDLLLVTSEAQLQARLADRLGLIFSTYLANTIGLALILALVLQSRVAKPLGRIAGAIRSYRFDREPLAPLPPGGARPDELQSLWQSFADLTAVLRDSWLQQRVMSAILEEAAVMALVCDADGLVLSSNAQARVRLLGAQPGGRLSRLAYGDETDLLFPQAADLLARGQAWRGNLRSPGWGPTPGGSRPPSSP